MVTMGIGTMTVGATLRERRLSLGKSQEDLADEIERDQNFISRLERGQHGTLQPETVRLLARALGYRREELLVLLGYLDEPGAEVEAVPDSVRVFTAMMGEVDSLADAPESLREHIKGTIRYALELERNRQQRGD
jgi:transcriptional regulator with XRE-family HTH domain